MVAGTVSWAGTSTIPRGGVGWYTLAASTVACGCCPCSSDMAVCSVSSARSQAVEHVCSHDAVGAEHGNSVGKFCSPRPNGILGAWE